MDSSFFDQIEFKNHPPKKGKVLISYPLLDDPHFKRTVILLVEHGKDGSVGFILNKNTGLKVNELVQGFPAVQSEVFYGGPVNNNNLYFLHNKGNLLDGSHEVLPGIFWGGDFDNLKVLLDTGKISEKDIRFFIGYSGWAKGQLNEELIDQSWIVGKITGKTIMQLSDKKLWSQILKGKGKKYEILSNFPEDPSLN